MSKQTTRLVLVLLLFVSTCAAQRLRLHIPPHDEIIRQLDLVAKEKNVYYHVWCSALYEGDKDEYSAIATFGGPLNIYYEDGATDHWYVHGLKTQDAAAWALVQTLKGRPNWKPQHKDKPKTCPVPSLSGGPPTFKERRNRK